MKRQKPKYSGKKPKYDKSPKKSKKVIIRLSQRKKREEGLKEIRKEHYSKLKGVVLKKMISANRKVRKENENLPYGKKKELPYNTNEKHKIILERHDIDLMVFKEGKRKGFTSSHMLGTLKTRGTYKENRGSYLKDKTKKS